MTKVQYAQVPLMVQLQETGGGGASPATLQMEPLVQPIQAQSHSQHSVKTHFHTPQKCVPQNSDFNPRGNVSAPIYQYAPPVTFVILVLSVILSFASVFNHSPPWKTFDNEHISVLLAPRPYVFGFQAVLLLLLAYYVGFHHWYPTNVYVRSLEVWFSVAFLADAIVQLCGCYSEFIVATVFSFISFTAVFIGLHRIYLNKVPCAHGQAPYLSSYIPTAFVASSYVGWLYFQVYLYLDAALTKHATQYFTPRGNESGPRALLIVMFVLAILIAMYFMDPHFLTTLAVVSIGVWDAHEENVSDFGATAGIVMAGFWLSVLWTIFIRFGTENRHHFITSVVIHPTL